MTLVRKKSIDASRGDLPLLRRFDDHRFTRAFGKDTIARCENAGSRRLQRFVNANHAAVVLHADPLERPEQPLLPDCANDRIRRLDEFRTGDLRRIRVRCG